MPFYACTYCTYVATTISALNAHLDRFIPDLAHLRAGKTRRYPPHPISILREGRYRDISGISWCRSKKRTERDVFATFALHMQTRLASESEKRGWQKRICDEVDADWWMGKVAEGILLYSDGGDPDLLAAFVKSVVAKARALCEDKGSELDSDSDSRQARNIAHRSLVGSNKSNYGVASWGPTPTVANCSGPTPVMAAIMDHSNCHPIIYGDARKKGQDTSSDSDVTTLVSYHRRKRQRRKTPLEESEEDLPIQRDRTSTTQTVVDSSLTCSYQPVASDKLSAQDAQHAGGHGAPMDGKAAADDTLDPLFTLTIKLLTMTHTTIIVPIDADTTMSSVIQTAWLKGPDAIRKLACKKVLVGTGKWQGVWEEVTWRRIKRAAKRRPEDLECIVWFGE